MHSIAPPQNSLYTPLRVHPIACFLLVSFPGELSVHCTTPHFYSIFLSLSVLVYCIRHYPHICCYIVVTLHWLPILFTVQCIGLHVYHWVHLHIRFTVIKRLHMYCFRYLVICCVRITGERHCLPCPIHFTNYVYCSFSIYKICCYCNWNLHIYVITMVTCYVVFI